MDAHERMVVERFKRDVDPSEDWEKLIKFKNTPPERTDDGEVTLPYDDARGLERGRKPSVWAGLGGII